jgi:hypothetical protein
MKKETKISKVKKVKEVKAEVVTTKATIDFISMDFGREDLNKLVDKINEIIAIIK